MPLGVLWGDRVHACQPFDPQTRRHLRRLRRLHRTGGDGPALSVAMGSDRLVLEGLHV